MKISELLTRAKNYDRAKAIADRADVDIDVHVHLNKCLGEDRKAWDSALVDMKTKAYGKGDVSIPLMPNFSVSYLGDATFLADIVCPRVPGNIARKFIKFSRRDQSRVNDLSFAAKARPREASIDVTNDVYLEKAYGEIMIVANAEIAEAVDIPDLFAMHQATLMNDILRAREQRVITLVTTSANYGGNTLALSGNNMWDVGATSSTADPINDIRVKAKAAVGVAGTPNGIMMSKKVAEILRTHPKVIAAAGTTATDRVVSDEQLRTLLDVKYLLISDVKVDTGAGSPTASYSYMMGNSVAILMIDPTAKRNDMSWCKTFRQEELEFTDSIDQVSGVRGTTILKGAHSDAEKVVAADRGFLLTNVIS